MLEQHMRVAPTFQFITNFILHKILQHRWRGIFRQQGEVTELCIIEDRSPFEIRPVAPFDGNFVFLLDAKRATVTIVCLVYE